MSEKSEILKEFENPRNLEFMDLVKVFVFMGVMILLFIPTIYIRNEIYYISRDMETLRTKHSVLVEENRALERKIEELKFVHEIVNPLSIEL
ncbi:MAG: hypothetical protein GXZ15_01080 [Campylobacter sp.]|nr:hypothetical protein [Campylobacter sp.]